MRSLPAFLLPGKIFEKFIKSISVLTLNLCDRGMRKIAAHNKNYAPTFEESVNFSKGVSFYPPILCDREVRGISSRAGTVGISRVHKREVVELCISMKIKNFGFCVPF